MNNFKKLSKYFLILFLFFLIVFNWQEISWIFNYRVVSELLSEVNFSEEEGKESVAEAGENYHGENKIVIPKIGIEAPLLFAENSDPGEMLDSGAVIFPDAVLPGEEGQTVILGHSAPPGWPKIKYDWIFSQVGELSEGDEVQIFFNNKKYTYLVKKQIILEVGDDIPQVLTTSKNMLVLVTCWPPGKDYKRLAVTAELFK